MITPAVIMREWCSPQLRRLAHPEELADIGNGLIEMWQPYLERHEVPEA